MVAVDVFAPAEFDLATALASAAASPPTSSSVCDWSRWRLVTSMTLPASHSDDASASSTVHTTPNVSDSAVSAPTAAHRMFGGLNAVVDLHVLDWPAEPLAEAANATDESPKEGNRTGSHAQSTCAD
jgi:hypothetical protein